MKTSAFDFKMRSADAKMISDGLRRLLQQAARDEFGRDLDERWRRLHRSPFSDEPIKTFEDRVREWNQEHPELDEQVLGVDDIKSKIGTDLFVEPVLVVDRKVRQCC